MSNKLTFMAILFCEIVIANRNIHVIFAIESNI